MREQGKNHLAKRPVAETPAGFTLHFRACGFQQRVVLHAGRTCGHARHTSQTSIDMFDEAGRIRIAAIPAQFHEVDAPPWRVGFMAPQQIGRACGKAEAAVDAVVEEIASR
jgi:hypothetical protein